MTEILYPFLQDGGEMGERTRAYNWAKTSLGTPENWPQSLRTTLSIILNSQFPMFLFWGPEHICFYNDAYRPSLGENGRHPTALGRPAMEVWTDIWDAIAPLIDSVMHGGPATFETDKLLPIIRNGKLDDAYWTASYSPVKDEAIGVAGVFVTCIETTVSVMQRTQLEERSLFAQGVINDSSVAQAVYLGEDMIIDTANQKMLELMGRDGSIIGTPFFQALPELQTTETAQRLHHVFTTGETFRQAEEQIMVMRHGEPHLGYYNFDYRALRDVTGAIYGVVNTAVEITEQVVSRRQLAESKEQFEFAVEAAELGIWDLNPDTGRFTANSTLKAWFGLQPDEEVPLSLAVENMVDRDRHRVADAISRAMEYDSGGRYDIQYAIRPPGEIAERLVRAKGRAWFRDDKTCYRFNGTLQDITSQEIARRAVEESEAKLRALVRQTPAPTLVLRGDDFLLEHINGPMLEMMGRSGEVIGQRFLSLMPELEGQYAWEQVKRVYQTGESFDQFEVLVPHNRTGVMQDYYYNVAYRPLIEGGRITGMIQVAIDVTGQVVAKKTLEQRENDLRNMVMQAPGGICVLDAATLVSEIVNDSFVEIAGRPREAILNRYYWDAFPETAPYYAAALQGVVDKGEAFYANEVELMLVKHGKEETVYVTFVYEPLKNAEGAVQKIIIWVLDNTQQVSARLKIAASEARFQTLIQQAPVAMSIAYGRDCVVETANDRMFEIWGKEPADVLGKAIFDAMPEARGQGFEEIIEQLFNTGETFKASEIPIALNRNGKSEQVYLNVVYQPVREGDNNITGIMQVAVEITDWVRSRKLIEESEARFRGLIEDAPMATSLYVGHGRHVVELANSKMLQLWGKDESVIGKPLIEALPELDGQPFLQILDEIYTSGKSFTGTGMAAELDIDGVRGTYYFDFVYKPLFDESGKVYAIMNMATDVTEQSLAHKKLQDTQATLSNAIELAELGTFDVNLLTGALTVSPRVADWFGFDELTAETEAFICGVDESEREAVRTALANAVAPGSDGRYDIVHSVINAKTSRKIIIHALGMAYTDGEGHPLRVEGTAQDITAQQSLQAALEQQVQVRTEELAATVEELQSTVEELAQANTQLTRSNDELAQYAYVASHDLQEPLRKIRVFTGMLTGYNGLSDTIKPTVEKISSSAERMSLLIQDLLAFSRLLQSDTLMRPIPLREIIEHVWKDFELIVAEKAAHIEVGELPVIEAVNLQMNQLFYNLIGNALKFTVSERVPLIKVSSRLAGAEEVAKVIPKPLAFATYHHITVTDNGIGFETQYNEQIFEVFKRLHGRENFPGSGIGLSICRRIAGNHNGYLYAVSEPQKGSTFHILLPDRQREEFFRENAMLAGATQLN